MNQDHLIGLILLGTCAFALITGLALMFPLPRTFFFVLDSFSFFGFRGSRIKQRNSVAELLKENEIDIFFTYNVVRPDKMVSEVIALIDFLMRFPKQPRSEIPRLKPLEKDKYPRWPNSFGSRPRHNLIYETKAYKTMLEHLPAAPEENENLEKVDAYFRNSVSRNPSFYKAFALDLSILHSASRIRLKRIMRIGYQRYISRGAPPSPQGGQRLWEARVYPGRIFRAVFIERKRRHTVRLFCGSLEGEKYPTPWDKDLFYSLKEATATKQEKDLFFKRVEDDLYRISRNKWAEKNNCDWLRIYFLACEQSGSLKALRSNKNIQAQTLKWLEEIGRPISTEDLLLELSHYEKERSDFIWLTFKNDWNAFSLGSSKLHVVAHPEKLLYFEEWADWGRNVTQEELDLQDIIYGLVERLFYEHMISIEDIVGVQDITDMNCTYQGSFEALCLIKSSLEK